MKKYLVLLLIGMPLALFSQERVTGKCIKGDCQNGEGSFQFDNGDQYIGEYRNGLRNGGGRYIYKSGDTYTGLWLHNQMHGHGKYDGVNYFYNGEWENNKQHGQGAIHFKTGKRAGDSYTGQFVNNRPQGKDGVYTYRDSSDKLKYVGEFVNGKFNGEGTLTYRDKSEDKGLWKDDIFLGTKIGIYHNLPVLKKGDTIITAVNNNKYLLSQQIIINQDNANPDEYGFIYPHGSFYIVDRTINSNNSPLVDEKNAIGYITFSKTGEITKLRPQGKDFKFYEIDCSEAQTLYAKFIDYCHWEICRMENTVNLNLLNFEDFSNLIDSDISDLKKILANKFGEIIITSSADLADGYALGIFEKIGNYLKKYGENAEKIIEMLKKEHSINTNTSLMDFLRDEAIAVLMSPYAKDAPEITDITKSFASCTNWISKSFATFMNEDNVSATTTIADFVRELVLSQDRNKFENKGMGYAKKIRNVMFGLVDDCLPKKFSTSLKKYYLYHIIKNSPEIGELIVLNFGYKQIRYSIKPEIHQTINTEIENSKKKKQFLEERKEYYQSKFENNLNNCLASLKIMNELRYECFHPYRAKVENDELVQMQSYVFGNNEISVCNFLSKEQLKPDLKQPLQVIQEEILTNKIIGKYKEKDVTIDDKYSKIYITALDKEFELTKQILDKSEDKVYFNKSDHITGKEEDKRYIIADNNKYIGWVEYNKFNTRYKVNFYELFDNNPNPNRIAVFVHGTEASPKTWKESQLTIPVLLEIVKTDTKNFDNSFDWTEYSIINNNYFHREKAAKKLVSHIQQFRGKYDEIVIIAHSHGGNVAIQAIDSISGFKKIMLLTLSTPAYNCKDLIYEETASGNKYKENYIPKIITRIHKENPQNIKNANFIQHTNISKKWDFVTGQISNVSDIGCSSKDRYNSERKTIDLLIENCSAATLGHSIQQSPHCLMEMRDLMSKSGIRF